MKKIIIIGAGPAGLAAAYRLVQHDYDVELFEASSSLGGLAKTINLWGQKVDLGPHRFFSSDPRVNEIWRDAIGEEFCTVNRLTRILYRGKLFNYPLEPLNAFSNLGMRDVFRSVISYFLSSFNRKEIKTFEDWVVRRFGRRLFEIFFRTYTEKVWGLSCKGIDAAWASQRIKKLSLFEAMKAAFFRNKRKKHKTLVDQFSYPHEGSGMLYANLAQKITERGGKIHLNTPVKEVLVRDQKITGVKFENGLEVFSSHVISTMPLTSMVQGLKDLPSEVLEATRKLRFRNTILVYLEMDGEALFPDQWIYIHSPELQHGRMTNFRNWGPEFNKGKRTTILCLEFWCFDEDPLWSRSAEELKELALKEVFVTGLLSNDVLCLNSHVLRINKSYPVYETGYQVHLEKIQRHLSQIEGLLAIGRYGSFKYNNQDHSILMGLMAAEEIMTGKSQKLWDINTENEYQESGEAKFNI